MGEWWEDVMDEVERDHQHDPATSLMEKWREIGALNNLWYNTPTRDDDRNGKM